MVQNSIRDKVGTMSRINSTGHQGVRLIGLEERDILPYAVGVAAPEDKDDETPLLDGAAK